MRLRFLLFTLLLIHLFSCNKSTQEDHIILKETRSNLALTDATSSISLVQLETDDIHLLGSESCLLIANDSYIIYQPNLNKIFRYSTKGVFLNEIGAHGRGPIEYEHLSSVQLLGDVVIVYDSVSGEVLRYNLDGTFISKESYESIGPQTWAISDGTLFTYYGFGSAYGYRAAWYNIDGEKTTILPSKEKVINLSPQTSIFCDVDNGITYIDSYTNTVHLFSDGKDKIYKKIDLGKYSIHDSFFQYEDSFAAMEYMLNNPLGLLQTYQESDEYKFVSIMLQNDGKVAYQYALCSNEKWSWFSLGTPGDDILAGAPCILSGNDLYYLIDPSLINTIPSGIKSMISNPEIIDTSKEDGNFIIAKFCLK